MHRLERRVVIKAKLSTSINKNVACSTFLVDSFSTVSGYHVYKSTWTPVVGERLTAASEPRNIHNMNAVAMLHMLRLVYM